MTSKFCTCWVGTLKLSLGRSGRTSLFCFREPFTEFLFFFFEGTDGLGAGALNLEGSGADGGFFWGELEDGRAFGWGFDEGFTGLDSEGDSFF